MKKHIVTALIVLFASILAGCGSLAVPFASATGLDVGVNATIAGVNTKQLSPTEGWVAAMAASAAAGAIASDVTKIEAGVVTGTPTAAQMNDLMTHLNADIAALNSLVSPVGASLERARLDALRGK